MFKISRRPVLGWAIALTAVCLLAWYFRDRLRPSPVTKAASPAMQPKRADHVGALGRFVPENGLLRIAAPYYESRPSVVERLAVREGELVRRGQLIAVLDGRRQVEAERASAAAQVEVARRRLEQVRAGAKPSDQQAQRAELRRAEAQYRHQQSELARSEALFASRNISQQALEEQRAVEQSSREVAEAARYRLSSMGEVRNEDVRVAESELALSTVQLHQIETRLAALTVFAPGAGVVVTIHARTGEQVGPEGILEMADVAHMEVEAEVYAGDIPAVRAGQSVVIEPEDAAQSMPGEVVRIGVEVRRATVMSGDPVSFNDARVVPVRIRVPACANTPCPINGRVRVSIGTKR